MKKTININLAGYPFTIDEDAYNLLKDYLDTIRFAFETEEDTGEIASDIEARIAEILIDRENGNVSIVTLDEISGIIERIGRPADFIEIEETEVEGKDKAKETSFEEKITPPPYDSSRYSRNPFVRKRLFRNPQNSMLGGVCSGLAAYLNMDVTIVRLIAVLLLFLSATTVAIIYIILWIVVPPANNPLQRMQMKGEDPTMENIGKTVTEIFQVNDTKVSQSNDTEDKGFLATAISIFVKCLIILGLIIIVPLMIAISAILIGCVIAVFVIGIGIASGGMFDSVNEGLMVMYILFAVIGGAITLGVPIWLLLRKLWKKNDVPSNPSTQRSILIIWLCGIALVSVFTVKAVKKGKMLEHKDWNTYIEKFEELNISEEDIEDINIKPGSVKVEGKNGKTIKVSPSGISITVTDKEKNDVASRTDRVEENVSPQGYTEDTIKSVEKIFEENNVDSIR